MDQTAKIICPGCNREVSISVQSVEVAVPEQLLTDNQYSDLRNISEQVEIPLATLIAEARQAAESLEDALPILERKYNICSFCGKVVK